MLAGASTSLKAFPCQLDSKPGLLADERLNSWEQITRYNNFYEFSTNKEAVAELAKELKTRPWSVLVDGEVDKPLHLDVDDLITSFDHEERIYRMRCVEGWSMVIPWNGFSLCQLLKRASPTSHARYVQFTALHDPAQMPGQRLPRLSWPYSEALTIAEAMHPLTTLATGLYGKPLPPQNGGPLRLIVPWKYGFKSIKCVVHISVERQRPATTWNIKSPGEYGFYANVDPQRPHTRWMQDRETRIGELRKRPTLPFNGYAGQVAKLYAGLDPSASL